MEQATAHAHARTRGENIASTMQKMAALPATGSPAFSPEIKESFNKLIESEMAFYQTLTKSWTDYFTGAESRRNAAAKAVLESNAKAVESGQEAVKSAGKYGEALIDWSVEASKMDASRDEASKVTKS